MAGILDEASTETKKDRIEESIRREEGKSVPPKRVKADDKQASAPEQHSMAEEPRLKMNELSQEVRCVERLTESQPSTSKAEKKTHQENSLLMTSIGTEEAETESRNSTKSTDSTRVNEPWNSSKSLTNSNEDEEEIPGIELDAPPDDEDK